MTVVAVISHFFLARCSRSSTPPIDKAQQRSRRKALMRHTVASCFPFQRECWLLSRLGSFHNSGKTWGGEDGGRNFDTWAYSSTT